MVTVRFGAWGSYAETHKEEANVGIRNTFVECLVDQDVSEQTISDSELAYGHFQHRLAQRSGRTARHVVPPHLCLPLGAVAGTADRLSQLKKDADTDASSSAGSCSSSDDEWSPSNAFNSALGAMMQRAEVCSASSLASRDGAVSQELLSDRPSSDLSAEDMDQLTEECVETSSAETRKTTVMMRNMPNNYTRSMVIELIDSEGFSGQYDFVYLPMDFQSHACLGYAFVNFVNHQITQRFWRAFDGFSAWRMPSRKVCSLSWSGPHQGLESHIARYRNSPVMFDSVPDEFKPIMMCNGKRVPFPPPNRRTRVREERRPHDRWGRDTFSGPRSQRTWCR